MHLALNAFFWNRPDTGSGQYLRQLVYHLNRLVSDLTITLIYPHHDDPELVPRDVKVRRAPARPGHLGKILFEQWTFPRVARAVGADVAHVPYWGPPLSAPLPLVVTIHDVITLRQREYRRGAGPRLYNALVSAGARAATHVITDSRFSLREIVESLALPEKNVTSIPLAVAPRYSPEPELLLEMAVRQKYGLPEAYLLYLGGYALHKNVMTLLAAYTYVAQALGDEYPLVLAGARPDPSPRFPDYESYIRRAGLEEAVRWIGYVAEEDKPAVYRGASCFAFPSRYEGFGLPPLEAMACGVPVVTTNSASLPEVVGDAAFAVDADDERHMAGAIISLIIQEEFAADMRQRGLQRAAQFSWEGTARETLLVYDNVAREI